MFPPKFCNHRILSEGFLNFVLVISKLRIMKKFITIADTNGKSWCVNTDAIIINKSILSYIIKPANADRIVANSTLCRTARYPR